MVTSESLVVITTHEYTLQSLSSETTNVPVGQPQPVTWPSVAVTAVDVRLIWPCDDMDTDWRKDTVRLSVVVGNWREGSISKPSS